MPQQYVKKLKKGWFAFVAWLAIFSFLRNTFGRKSSGIVQENLYFANNTLQQMCNVNDKILPLDIPQYDINTHGNAKLVIPINYLGDAHQQKSLLLSMSFQQYESFHKIIYYSALGRYEHVLEAIKEAISFGLHELETCREFLNANEGIARFHLAKEMIDKKGKKREFKASAEILKPIAIASDSLSYLGYHSAVVYVRALLAMGMKDEVTSFFNKYPLAIRFQQFFLVASEVDFFFLVPVVKESTNLTSDLDYQGFSTMAGVFRKELSVYQKPQEPIVNVEREKKKHRKRAHTISFPPPKPPTPKENYYSLFITGVVVLIFGAIVQKWRRNRNKVMKPNLNLTHKPNSTIKKAPEKPFFTTDKNTLYNEKVSIIKTALSLFESHDKNEGNINYVEIEHSKINQKRLKLIIRNCKFLSFTIERSFLIKHDLQDFNSFLEQRLAQTLEMERHINIEPRKLRDALINSFLPAATCLEGREVSLLIDVFRFPMYGKESELKKQVLLEIIKHTVEYETFSEKIAQKRSVSDSHVPIQLTLKTQSVKRHRQKENVEYENRMPSSQLSRVAEKEKIDNQGIAQLFVAHLKKFFPDQDSIVNVNYGDNIVSLQINQSMRLSAASSSSDNVDIFLRWDALIDAIVEFLNNDQSIYSCLDFKVFPICLKLPINMLIQKYRLSNNQKVFLQGLTQAINEQVKLLNKEQNKKETHESVQSANATNDNKQPSVVKRKDEKGKEVVDVQDYEVTMYWKKPDDDSQCLKKKTKHYKHTGKERQPQDNRKFDIRFESIKNIRCRLVELTKIAFIPNDFLSNLHCRAIILNIIQMHVIVDKLSPKEKNELKIDVEFLRRLRNLLRHGFNLFLQNFNSENIKKLQSIATIFSAKHFVSSNFFREAYQSMCQYRMLETVQFDFFHHKEKLKAELNFLKQWLKVWNSNNDPNQQLLLREAIYGTYICLGEIVSQLLYNKCVNVAPYFANAKYAYSIHAVSKINDILNNINQGPLFSNFYNLLISRNEAASPLMFLFSTLRERLNVPLDILPSILRLLTKIDVLIFMTELGNAFSHENYMEHSKILNLHVHFTEAVINKFFEESQLNNDNDPNLNWQEIWVPPKFVPLIPHSEDSQPVNYTP